MAIGTSSAKRELSYMLRQQEKEREKIHWVRSGRKPLFTCASGRPKIEDRRDVCSRRPAENSRAFRDSVGSRMKIKSRARSLDACIARGQYMIA